MKKLVLGGLAAVVLSTPALAGEINGKGEFLDMNGRSSCAFSGLNDTPDGDAATSDPGGRVQSYGFFLSQTWLAEFLDPQANDPREPSLSPGWACNPQRGGAFEPGG